MDGNFSDQLYSNPMALAGLAVLGGKPMGDALMQSAVASEQYQHQKVYQQQIEQQKQLQAQLPQILSNVDTSNPRAVFSALASAGVPVEHAATITETLAKQARYQQDQQGMDQFFQSMNGTSTPAAPPMPAGGQPMPMPPSPQPDAGGGIPVSADPTSATPAQDVAPTPQAATPITQPAPQATQNPYDDQIAKGRMAMQFGIKAKNPAIVQYGSGLVTQGTEAKNRAEDEAKKDQQRQEDITRKDAQRQEDHAREDNKPLSGSSASNLALVDQGTTAVSDIKSLIYNDDGTLDKKTILDAKLPTPLSNKGRKLKSAMHSAGNAKVRIESGAVAPTQEMFDNAVAYLPGLADDMNSSNFKLDSMNNFFKDYQKIGGRPGDKATAGSPASVAPQASAAVPPTAIQFLRSNPALAGDFEKKYGISAKQYLQ